MSSLRNAFKTQKTHRERHQPEDRKDLGLLEKKKDYKLRAQDYNKKKKVLQKLRVKALNKNPDEFHHHMINSQMVEGVHREKNKDEQLTEAQIKLLQNRDLTYIVQKRTIERKKIEKLKSVLHMLDVEDKPSNSHTFFVDTEKEKHEFDPARRLNTHPDLLDRTYNRPLLSDLQSGNALPSAELSSDTVKRRQKAYKELKQRIERERQLGVVQAKMEVKKQMQSKKEKPVALIKSETKDSAPVYKWPKERKR